MITFICFYFVAFFTNLRRKYLIYYEFINFLDNIRNLLRNGVQMIFFHIKGGKSPDLIPRERQEGNT